MLPDSGTAGRTADGQNVFCASCFAFIRKIVRQYLLVKLFYFERCLNVGTDRSPGCQDHNGQGPLKQYLPRETDPTTPPIFSNRFGLVAQLFRINGHTLTDRR
jgi:hypothetical protein